MTLTAADMATARVLDTPVETLVERNGEVHEVPGLWSGEEQRYDNMGDGTLYCVLREEGEDEVRSVADAAARLKALL